VQMNYITCPTVQCLKHMITVLWDPVQKKLWLSSFNFASLLICQDKILFGILSFNAVQVRHWHLGFLQ
jgi:hypothetical protein